MPTTVVHKIDVTSPLVRYTGPWIRGGLEEGSFLAGQFADPDQPRYDQGTFIFCDPGLVCTATLAFRGTEVHVVGAFRSNSGPIQSSRAERTDLQAVDTSNQPPKSSKSTSSIGQTSPKAPHQLNITNFVSGDRTYDVDFVCSVRGAVLASQLSFRRECGICVRPANAWSTDMANLTGFDDGTGQYVGSLRGLYRTHPSKALGLSALQPPSTSLATEWRYMVQSAGMARRSPHNWTAGPSNRLTQQQDISDTPSENYLANQLIYYADGLGLRKHTLVLASTASSTSQKFTIDYVVVDGTANTLPKTTAATPASPTPVSPDAPTVSGKSRSDGNGIRLSTAQAGGIAAAVGVLLVLAVSLIVYVVWLRRSYLPHDGTF
ncbi:hypothetical protein C8F01DRAFT_1249726 [Mycena amicta]|nr:hypothetical protein C8F01DRAFT_1249726 [Mycena amicta]